MKIVSRAVKTACIFAAGWCLLGSSAAQAQVLDQVPTDSIVVFKIHHLADTNKKVADLLQSLGVTDLVPTMKDPLQALEDQLGISAGLDSSKDAAAAILNGPMDGGGPPPFVLLLPVTDYKAFLGNMTLVRTEGDVSVVHFKDKEDDAFVENWGGYAALSDKKDNVTGKHEGIKLSGLSAKQMSERDLCIYVNMPVVKSLLLPKLDDSEKMLNDQVDKNTPEDKKKLAHAAVKQLLQVAREFLNDAQGTTIGIGLSDQGISSSMIVELTPDSYLGKIVSQMKNTDQSLLSGLPKENYLAFGGSVEDGKLVLQVINDTIGPVMTELAASGDDGKKLADSINEALKPMATVEGGTFGIVAPTAALGQGSLIRFIGLYKGDAEALKANASKAGNFMTAIMKMSGKDGQTDLMKTTITPEVKTINGVKFDQIKVEANPDNTSQQAMQMGETMSRMYGPDGLTELFGAVDAKTLVVSLGVDDDLLGQAVDAAKSNTDVLTDGIASVDAGLPKKRAGAFYIGLGQIFSTALDYAKANGLNVPVQIPNNLPPVGITFGTEGSAMRGDEFIPMKLLQTLVQAGLQTYMQMNNRNGNGGGGGL
jgi:hypothetical protein